MIVAAAQFSCTPGDIAANVRTMAGLVRAADGARLVVFPELALTGYELELVAHDPGLQVGESDPRLDAVREACRTAGAAAVVNGAAPPARSDARLPGLTSYVIGPDGSTLARYDKQHLHGAEREVFTAGEGDGRFTLDGHRFALATCFDNHFPELGGRAAEDGCAVYLASALYGTGDGVRERAETYPAIARDNGLYVVLANHVGPAGPWTGCGRSAVWGPDGMPLAEADAAAPGLVRAELPLQARPSA
ncbi:carbon-nitrogen hydrolase family protein [Streptomyces sp. MUM 203J]|uniref:carbon-nitrogen hydrolase family protein n=1 Tax=Streptomyces sp. MUM 203J TaxID=2791990 RepID=UPI001F03E814|nr:carbon-nitrogen hydrolase family protein [Streptomyces sp. MUM 203J]MCH0540681.1 carbon-nitrogen hydrolase family protein [Streptomyces sp. MUM 203J]